MTIQDRNPTPEEVLETFEALCVETQRWLATFSTGPKKWPDHEIERKTRRLWVFGYVAQKQRNAIEARKQV